MTDKVRRPSVDQVAERMHEIWAASQPRVAQLLTPSWANLPADQKAIYHQTVAMVFAALDDFPGAEG